MATELILLPTVSFSNHSLNGTWTGDVLLSSLKESLHVSFHVPLCSCCAGIWYQIRDSQQLAEGA